MWGYKKSGRNLPQSSLKQVHSNYWEMGFLSIVFGRKPFRGGHLPVKIFTIY